MVIVLHKRGSRAVGWPVKIDGKVYNVNGRGEIHLPDDVSGKSIELLREGGHRVKGDPVEEDTEEDLEDEGPFPWYPSDLQKIKGIGEKTAEHFEQSYPDPRLILSETGERKVGGIKARTWNKVRDFIDMKIREEE